MENQSYTRFPGSPVDGYQKVELPNTSLQPGIKTTTLLDSKEIGELGGSDVNEENGLTEVDGECPVELPTASNERMELEALHLRGKDVS
jgi:ABC-type uncharacterized transport system involved in gliding motility auxiliary subunit